MTSFHLAGLTVAALTPFDENGELRLQQVDRIVEHLIQNGASGLYVCGSTGSGVSLTDPERKAVAEAYVRSAGGRVPVVVQVGHNSLSAARELAAHAQGIGADAISANGPSYFKLDRVETLVDMMEYVTADAQDLPFYYYHIPVLTGLDFDMVEFLQRAAPRIRNLVGLKYTSPALDQYQRCLELDGGRFDVLWGVDEMMLGALAVGATGAVGSTYNVAAQVYLRMMAAFRRGDIGEARSWQSRSIELISVLASYPFYASLRELMKLLGMDCGACRLPQKNLTGEQAGALKRDLDGIGFFTWGGAAEGQKRLRHDAVDDHRSVAPPAASPHRLERI